VAPSPADVSLAAPKGADFPTTGRAITVKLLSSRPDSSTVPVLIREFQGCMVTSDWELCHLLLASEEITGLPREAQKLYHAGRELLVGQTIRGFLGLSEHQLPAKFALHVVVDEDQLQGDLP